MASTHARMEEAHTKTLSLGSLHARMAPTHAGMEELICEPNCRARPTVHNNTTPEYGLDSCKHRGDSYVNQNELRPTDRP